MIAPSFERVERNGSEFGRVVVDDKGNPWIEGMGERVPMIRVPSDPPAEWYAGYANPLFWLRNPNAVRNLSDSPYADHPWTYATVQALVRGILSLPFVIYRGKRRPVSKAGAVDVRSLIHARQEQEGEEKQRAAEDHPLVRLFENPHPEYTALDLWEATVVHLDAGGELFWVLSGRDGKRITRNAVPEEIWPLGPAGWHPAKDKEGTQGIGESRVPPYWAWRSTDDSAKLYVYERREVVHFTRYNPYSMYRGLGSARAAKAAAAGGMAATQFNLNSIKNGMDPGGIVKIDGSPSPEDKKALKQSLRDYEGEGNRGRTLLLSKGMDYLWNPRSPKDAEFVKLYEFGRDEVIACRGVPKSIVSITDSVPYATAMADRARFYENAVIPLALCIEMRLWQDLFRHIDSGAAWGEFDLSTATSLLESVNSTLDAGLKYFQLGYSRDEVNTHLRLGMKPDPETDIRGGPGAMLPTSLIVGGQDETEGDESDDAPEPTTDPEALAAQGNLQGAAMNGPQIASMKEIVADVAAGTLPAESAIAMLLASFPTIDQDEAEAMVLPAAAKASEEEAAAQAESQAAVAEATAALEAEQKAWLAAALRARSSREDRYTQHLRVVGFPKEHEALRAIVKYYQSLKREQLALWKIWVKAHPELADVALPPISEADFERILFQRLKWDREFQRVLSPRVKDTMRAAAKGVAGEISSSVISLTNPRMLEVHARALGVLVDVNKSTRLQIRSTLIRGVEEGGTIHDLQGSLKQYFDGSNVRALRVARTETGFASNGTRVASFAEAGIRGHEWFTAGDSAVRESHKKNDGVVRHLGHAFPNGLRHPLELGAPAGEVVNCRCRTFASDEEES